MDFFELDMTRKNENGFYGPTYEEWQAALEAERLAQESLKQSALEKLSKLGLTEEEAKAVIGL